MTIHAHIERQLLTRLRMHWMDEDDVDDLRQVIRLGIHHALGVWTGTENPCDAWVRTVARRYALDNIWQCGGVPRSAYRREAAAVAAGEERWLSRYTYLQEDLAPDVDTLCSVKRRADHLHVSIDSLPASQAAIIRAYYLSERAAPDIAEEFGVTRTYVYAQIRRGLERLNSLMAA